MAMVIAMLVYQRVPHGLPRQAVALVSSPSCCGHQDKSRVAVWVAPQLWGVSKPQKAPKI